MAVTFKNNIPIITEKINKRSIAFLYEVKDSLASQTARLTPIESGALKQSFTTDSTVDEVNHTAYIGSSLNYAPYVELGTGEYALMGNGRKGGWFYEKDGKLYFTKGQSPKRMLYHSFILKKEKIKKEAKSIFEQI